MADILFIVFSHLRVDWPWLWCGDHWPCAAGRRGGIIKVRVHHPFAVAALSQFGDKRSDGAGAVANLGGLFLLSVCGLGFGDNLALRGFQARRQGTGGGGGFRQVSPIWCCLAFR